jgi:hypothetical protein
MKNKKLIYILPLLLLILLASLYALNEKNTQEENKPAETGKKSMSFFITSSNPGKGGNLGGLAGADAYCASLAEASGTRGRVWGAYLSSTEVGATAGVNARDRIGSGPWYNAKGELIAMNLTQLHSNNMLDKQTALTEKGEIVLGRGDKPNEHDILTGSDSMGMLVATSTDTTCANWTSSDAGSAYVGHHDRIGINDSAPMKSWNSSHLTRGCSLSALSSTGGSGRFYCFAK